MGPLSHTKFERNPPSRLRDMEDGCARAHVQIHPTSELCRSSWSLSTRQIWTQSGPAVVELPMERMSPTPSPRHVRRAVAGTGGYRCRSNTKFIEWWHRTKKTARESVNPFQRYKLLKSVTGSGRVGLGRAAHTEQCSSRDGLAHGPMGRAVIGLGWAHNLEAWAEKFQIIWIGRGSHLYSKCPKPS